MFIILKHLKIKLKESHRTAFCLCFFLCISQIISAQYLIKGNVKETNHEVANLCILNTWDAFNSISSEMIIKSSKIDSLGNFMFSGNEFDNKNAFYRIHFTKTNNKVAINGNEFSFVFSNRDTLDIVLKNTSNRKIFNILPLLIL